MPATRFALRPGKFPSFSRSHEIYVNFYEDDNFMQKSVAFFAHAFPELILPRIRSLNLNLTRFNDSPAIHLPTVHFFMKNLITKPPPLESLHICLPFCIDVFTLEEVGTKVARFLNVLRCVNNRKACIHLHYLIMHVPIFTITTTARRTKPYWSMNGWPGSSPFPHRSHL